MNKTYLGTVLSIVLLTATNAFSQVKTFTKADAIAASAAYNMGCIDETKKIAEKIDFKFVYGYEATTGRERTTTYFNVSCAASVEKAISVLLRVSDSATTLQPVSFAVPRLNSSGQVVGFTASVVAGYLNYDPATKTLSTLSKGRGLGDLYVSVSGLYQLHETEVILRSYTIDAVEGDDEVVPPIFESQAPLK